MDKALLHAGRGSRHGKAPAALLHRCEIVPELVELLMSVDLLLLDGLPG